jgi:hypothetical protein
MYDNFIEYHLPSFDQHTALLSARGCAIDHSFKVCDHLPTLLSILIFSWQIAKQIAKVQGEKVFEALLSITNEYGQIRVCDLVPTKAHSQFDIALSRMFDSLNTYGLPHPEVFFTDNMADKNMLEKHFPSLTKGVTPITEHGDLPLFEIPSHVSITCHRSVTEIQDAMRTIIDQAPEGEELIVALDSEWDVDTTARRHHIPDPQTTAVLQLAHGNNIWIFQVSIYISGM